MKRRAERSSWANMMIAPYTGARIETHSYEQREPILIIAPYTGARIETLPGGTMTRFVSHRPLHGGAD